MSERDAFLKALAENEDDITTRLVFADWLDEQGEHEEADRQRKWPAAKEWLVEVCKFTPGTYTGLIDFGRQVVREEGTSDRVYLDYDDVWHALKPHGQEFWKNWSVVTGIPLPPTLEAKGFHYWACCSHEVYYWFGFPDTNEAEELEELTTEEVLVDPDELGDAGIFPDPGESGDDDVPGDADE